MTPRRPRSPRTRRASARCPVCEVGRLRPGKIPYEYAGVRYGEYAGEVCDRCGEDFLTQAASDAIEAKAKGLGHWGIAKRSKVGTSGHSLMVRIPKDVERELGIEKGDAVVVRPEGKNRIVIEIEDHSKGEA